MDGVHIFPGCAGCASKNDEAQRHIATLVTPRHFHKMPHQISPARILSRVIVINRQLEKIRIAIGKPDTTNSILQVKRATPRDVYFLSQLLYQKIFRLSTEITGDGLLLKRTTKDNDVSYQDVWEVLEQSLAQIENINERLYTHCTSRREVGFI